MIILALFIGSTGAVQATDVLYNDTGAFELACCVENRLSTWWFAPGGCRTHIVRIPFQRDY